MSGTDSVYTLIVSGEAMGVVLKEDWTSLWMRMMGVVILGRSVHIGTEQI